MTPGPWIRNVRPNLPIYAGRAPNHTLVALALDCPDQEANWKAIAAVPELIDALKLSLHAISNLMTDDQLDQRVPSIDRTSRQAYTMGADVLRAAGEEL